MAIITDQLMIIRAMHVCIRATDAYSGIYMHSFALNLFARWTKEKRLTLQNENEKNFIAYALRFATAKDERQALFELLN
jgi:hypothetical protein